MLSEIKNQIVLIWKEFQRINARLVQEEVDQVDTHFKMTVNLAAGSAFVTGNPVAFLLVIACNDTTAPQRPGLFQDNPFSADGGEADDSSAVPDQLSDADAGEPDATSYTNCQAFEQGSTCFIRKIAGRTFPYNFDDGIPATEATFQVIDDMAFHSSGDLYLVDDGSPDCASTPCKKLEARIRKIDHDGIISTVFSDIGDSPMDIAFGPDDSLFITDYDLCTLSKILPDGTTSLIAASSHTSDDSCPSIPEAPVQLQRRPSALAVDLSGNIYVAEIGNPTVSKISPDNELTPLINHIGLYGFEGDGGPALDAQMRNILDMILDVEGNLLLADTWNHRIRRYNAVDRTIETIAGSGDTGDEWKTGGGFAGDGGPATSALLNHPSDIAVACDGTIFVTDFDNGRIRMVQEGIISTYAGGGETLYIGEDPIPVNQAWIVPGSLALNASGELYIEQINIIYKVECEE